ncbi:hypothetical protein ES703_73758 [subsurface metagenome]
MACGADYGSYEASYDAYVAYEVYEIGQRYDGNPAGYSQFCYESDLSRGHIEGEALEAQQAGYK